MTRAFLLIKCPKAVGVFTNKLKLWEYIESSYGPDLSLPPRRGAEPVPASYTAVCGRLRAEGRVVISIDSETTIAVQEVEINPKEVTT